jgi:hypothetical protein
MMQSTGVVRPLRLWIGVLVFASAALCTSVTASAQAYRWYDWFAGLPRVRSTRSCAIQFRGELVVSMPGYGFKAWNGSSWRALPNVALTADAMAVFGDRLYAAGSGKLISFDGNSWTYHGSFGGIVMAMIPFNGELIIGGFFTNIGGVKANRIARFNGARFAPIGGGFNAGFVGALATLNGKLFAAGSFGSPTNRLPPGVTDPNRVAFWNGSGWQTAGTGLNSTVEALTVYNGKLIAGGWFNITGPGSGARVAQFDGTNWTSLSPTFNKNVSTIFTLASTDNGIVAGGYFHNTEGLVGAMFFNGTDWVAMDGGLTTTNGLSYVWNSATFRDQFVLLGDFELSGAVPAYGMAVWGPSAGASGLRVDTNSDGRRDIMLRNPLTGMLRSWELDSNLNPSSRDIIVTGTDWDMVGTGDFNADGQTDFLWFQASTGRVHMSMFIRGKYHAPREMRGAPRANLVIAGVADMNGDFTPDIIWRDTSSGAQGIWLLTPAGTPTFSPLPNVPMTEELVLVSDIDSNGSQDIVYRTIATGALYARRVVGSTLAAAVAITTPGPGWKLAAAPDYNGDFNTDRLWVKSGTNEAMIQIMGAGGTVQTTKNLPNIPAGFVVKR